MTQFINIPKAENAIVGEITSPKSKTHNFILPKVNPTGIAIKDARMVGELITIAVGEARNNTKKYNPYFNGISPANPADMPISISELGTEVYSDVTFQTVTYTDNNGNSVTTPEMTFESILVDVVFPRNIVRTEIQGRDNDVIEYIGEGNADITFRGIMTTGQKIFVKNKSTGKLENKATYKKSLNGVFPAEAIAALKQVIKAPVEIPVVCKYLETLDIHSIVFLDRTLGQEEGGYSYQQYTLNAISVVPIELQINGM
jgi:hypothetical protein